MINQLTIGFIGAGNMASALIRGLIGNGIDAQRIRVADPDQDKLQALQKDCGIAISPDNAALAQAADVIVLAVKPQVMGEVVSALAPALAEKSPLLISVAAGISLDSLRDWSHAQQPIVRCMPNTPALVQCGASALFANAAVNDEQQQLANDIMSAVGTVVWLENEQQMDAVTALSGSGPAYFFLLTEAMQMAAVKLGLSMETATQLSLQTALGAARLARDSDVEVAELRRRVTSPKGTTEAALEQFLSEGFMGIVERSMDKAAQRSEALSREAAKQKKKQ